MDISPRTPITMPPERPKTSVVTWVALGVAILGGASAGAYYLGQKSAPIALPIPTPFATLKPTATPVPTPSPRPSVDTTSVTDDGVTWLAEPQEVKGLSLLSISSTSDYFNSLDKNNIHYYKIGSDSGKDIILGEVIGSFYHYAVFHFLKNNDKDYELLTSHSESQLEDKTYGGLALGTKITKQNPKLYQSIKYQPTLSLQKTDLSSSGNDPIWFQEEQRRLTNYKPPRVFKKFETTAYGDVYRLTETGYDDYQMDKFFLRRPDGTGQYYQLRPDFIGDDYIPRVTWNDGTKNTAQYRIDGLGSCGSSVSLAILGDNTMSNLEAGGKTDKGETVYVFKTINSPIAQNKLDGYNDYVSHSGSDTDFHGNPAKPLTADEFLKAHPLFVYKDALDRLILFDSEKYGHLAECGKPVIYLYPTKKTDISVKVGANITVSEPDYGSGWQVTAQPDGTLTTQDGKTYHSLYWEGIGKEYPSISEGTVIPTNQVESTIRTQLAQLSLNTQETTDFLEFWLPKMPKTPFVRLTWFGTRQMDRLAPLIITPRPDTVLRVFLDFEGLQSPISLPAQHLTALPRKGFTVVEWGGLLRK